MNGSGSFLDQCWVVLAPNGIAYGDDNCRDGRPKLCLTREEANLAAKIFSGEQPMRYGEYRRQRAIDHAVRSLSQQQLQQVYWHHSMTIMATPCPVCDFYMCNIRTEFARIMERET